MGGREKKRERDGEKERGEKREGEAAFDVLKYLFIIRRCLGTLPIATEYATYASPCELRATLRRLVSVDPLVNG